MKKKLIEIIIFFILFLPVSVMGQIDTTTIHNGKTTPILYDTITIVMIVSDTISKTQFYYSLKGKGLIIKETISIIPRDIWQMKGYEVKKLVNLDWVHVSYLDQNKKSLNLMVWMKEKSGK